ncbi:hypothetical protein [Nocardiopsis lambiniae]|uniref:Core-binding (CB) domain-containing protein n=1 Tax=Nocardiopsis lambiniae TaxID=3075539 RepID=A0ABU2M6J9_9ACTN|nr:hypothetical protein [Nocardiopsis sp. DSM 44743]MDT0328289.1 hypothetical protein [Nocardiopsis sp. DSM 44743]
MATRYLRRGPRNLAAGPLKPHIDSFVLYLRAEGRSRKTITLYSQAASWFAAEHLPAGGQPTDTDRRAFVTGKGRPLTESVIYQMVCRRACRASVDDV